MRVAVRFTDKGEFKAKMDNFLRGMPDAMKKTLLQFGFLTETEAKRLVPIRTGKLWASIQMFLKEQSVLVGTDVEYAPFVEFGTIRMRARPYLRPAAYSAIQQLKGSDKVKFNVINLWENS